MGEDIPALLRDAAADPSHTPDFGALAAHGRRQHLAGRVATAAVAVVALVAGGVVLWPAAEPADRMPPIDDAPTGSEQASPAAVLPTGWHEIRVGDAILGVPGDWTVETLGEPTPICPNTADRPTAYVHLAGLADERVCQLSATFTLTVEVAPLADVPDRFLEAEEGRSWQPVTPAQGLQGERLAHDDRGSVIAYRFPQLDLWLQFADGDPVGNQADPILDTIARVVEAVPLARGDLPAGWQPIEAGDASFGVPDNWAVAHVSLAETACPNVFNLPTVMIFDPDRPNVRPAECDLSAGTQPTLTAGSLAAYSARADWAERPAGEPVVVNGNSGEKYVMDDEGGRDVITYEFDSLDLLLWFRRVDLAPDLPGQVLNTLTTARSEPPPSPSSSPTGETEAAEASLATPRPVPDDPDPLTRAGAAGVKVECVGPAHLGGWALDFGGPAVGAPDPQGALQAFLDQGLFGLPQEGYELAAREPGRVLFTYTVDSNPKVAVIVADSAVVDEQLTVENGWGIETFATCDPAEYAPATDDELGQTVWTDRDGNRVPTSTITSYPGPAHCGWQSVTFLHLDDRQYLRDPQDLLRDQTTTPYNGDGQLPADATDTGYRNNGQELWLSPDADIAYIVTNTTVEAWPATTNRVACA